MLNVLKQAEKDMRSFLADKDGWKSLDINYHPPRVERVWRQWGEYRIMLHRIHPCDNALMHPHPWPSAIYIASGSYEMGLGYSNTTEKPPIVAKIIAGRGSRYEMVDKYGWHYVIQILSYICLLNR